MITARNTNEMMYLAYDYILTHGITEYSRNGPVISVPHPVTLHYTHPMEKVNFCPIRDANPYFHFFESLWMIAGRNDVNSVAQFAKQMREYSDDGEVFNAPYGSRIRVHWGDQLQEVVQLLRQDPFTRQAVIQIWDRNDLTKCTKDKACNMSLMFRIIGNHLNMTVCNRSNDGVWGAVSGANITNLPIFQEYISAHLNLQAGSVYVMSNNLHVYLDNPKTDPLLRAYGGKVTWPKDPYETGVVKPYPLIKGNPRRFDEEVRLFMVYVADQQHPLIGARLNDMLEATENPIWMKVAYPMIMSWRAHKAKDRKMAKSWALSISAPDWSMACLDWLERRYEPK